MSEEIDALAVDDEKSNFILGECKFTNQPFDLGQLNALKDKNRFGSNVHYYLFSLNGFTDTLINESKKLDNITMVTAEDIINFYSDLKGSD